MENIRLILKHHDRIYAYALAAALSEKWRAISVCVATDHIAEGSTGSDFVLCDSAQSALTFGVKGIHLYDDKEDMIAEVPAVARFQPISAMVSALKNICAYGGSKNSIIPQIPGKVLFIGFTSGSGGVGTSTSAVILGRILSRLYSRKTLYIAFERSNPFDYAFSFESPNLPLDHLLYRISTGDCACFKLINEYAGKDSYGLYAMSVQSCLNPLALGTEDDVFQLLSVIAEYGNYDRVVLDVPFDFVYWKNIMRLCEKQVIHYGFREHCHVASDRAKGEMEELCELDHINAEDRILELRTLRDEDSFIISEHGFDVDIHGQLGAEVRELADRLESG